MSKEEATEDEERERERLQIEMKKEVKSQGGRENALVDNVHEEKGGVIESKEEKDETPSRCGDEEREKQNEEDGEDEDVKDDGKVGAMGDANEANVEMEGAEKRDGEVNQENAEPQAKDVHSEAEREKAKKKRQDEKGRRKKGEKRHEKRRAKNSVEKSKKDGDRSSPANSHEFPSSAVSQAPSRSQLPEIEASSTSRSTSFSSSSSKKGSSSSEEDPDESKQALKVSISRCFYHLRRLHLLTISRILVSQSVPPHLTQVALLHSISFLFRFLVQGERHSCERCRCGRMRMEMRRSTKPLKSCTEPRRLSSSYFFSFPHPSHLIGSPPRPYPQRGHVSRYIRYSRELSPFPHRLLSTCL